MTEMRHITRTSNPLAGLVDALDRVLDGGAAVAGGVIISLDGIDLVKLDLRLLLAGIQGVDEGGAAE